MTRFRALAAALLLTAFAGSTPGAMAQGGCISGRGEERQLIQEGKVVSLGEALQRAGLSSDQVVEVQLCQAGGGYVYRVRVLQPGGKVRGMNIPAN
jgi:hypothetical protein